MDQTQVLIQQQIFIRILQRNVVSSCYGRRCEFTVWILVETRYRHGFLRFSSSMNDIHDLKGKLEKLTHCLVLIKSPLIVDAFFPLINSFARNFVKFASNETPELRFVLALEIIIIRRVGNECSRNREFSSYVARSRSTDWMVLQRIIAKQFRIIVYNYNNDTKQVEELQNNCNSKGWKKDAWDRKEKKRGDFFFVGSRRNR